MKKLARVVAVVSALAGSINANAALDANYTASASQGNIVLDTRFDLAQTFTAQSTGALTSVDLYIGYLGQLPNNSFILQIQDVTAGGLPSGNVLGTASLPSSALAGYSTWQWSWQTFNFTNVNVVAGQKLAFVANTYQYNSEYMWNADLAWTSYSSAYPNGTYSGGQAYSNWGSGWSGISLCNYTCNDPSKVDFSFRTNVEQGAMLPVPEPENYAMMLAGLGMLGGIAKRRRRQA